MTEESADHGTPFDKRELRDALSSFSTGVTIVTASDAEGAPVGVTASSFNSVSMEPPLILWSVTKAALSAEVFRSAGHFAVHVLAVDQIALSNRFAKSGTDKFSGTGYNTDANGVPILPGTACRFDCRTWQVYEGGDHWIIVGEVETIDPQNKDSLVFSGGTYATAVPIRTPVRRVEPEQGFRHPLDHLMLYNLGRADRQMSANFHAMVHNEGFTVPEWRVMANISQQAEVDLDTLATRTLIDPELLVDLVQSMQAEGICSAEQTGGVWRITGTEKGRKMVEEMTEKAAALERKAVGNLGAERQAELLDMIEIVVANTRPDDVGA